MSPTSQKIYDYLRDTVYTNKPISMGALENYMHVHSRGLQAEDGDPGPLDIARNEIFDEHGVVLITMTGRSGGVMLTGDVEKVKHARNQLNAHLFSEMKKVNSITEILRKMETKSQLALGLPPRGVLEDSLNHLVDGTHQQVFRP